MYDLTDNSSNKNLISIIVPVYNVEHYLRQCVNSILAQTYRNIEVILVDDGSTDKSGAICDDYQKEDSRVKVIHKENGGLSTARNSGLEIARGEWISFIDSDDYIEIDMLQLLLESCLKHDIFIAAAGIKKFDDETGKVVHIYTPIEAETVTSNEFIDSLTLRDVHYGPMFSACNKLYHEKLWKHYRFPVGRNWEDLAVLYKIIDEAGKVAIVGKAVYAYRERIDSITMVSSIHRYDDLEKSAKEFLDWSVSMNPELIDAARSYYILMLLAILSEAAICGEREYYKAMRQKLAEFRKYKVADKYIRKSERIKLWLSYSDLYYYAYSFYVSIKKRLMRRR